MESPKPFLPEGRFNSQASSVSANIQTSYDGAYTASNPAPVSPASVPDSDPLSKPHSIYCVTNSLETVPIEDEPSTGLNSGEEEDCVSSPSRDNSADLLCDLFPELQTFATTLPEGVETMGCGDVPVESISVHVTPAQAGLEGHVSPEADVVSGGFPKVPWTLAQPSLSDLSLLSNDEMDLELERFGYSNCFDTKDVTLSPKDEEEASHKQLCSNINSFQQGGTLIREEKGPEALELQDSYSEILYPQVWGDLQDIHPGEFLGPHHLGEAYSGLDAAMTNDHTFNFPSGESPGPFSTQFGSFITCPYPKNSPTSLYIDKCGVMKDACYCDEATDIACPGPYSAVDVTSYSLTTGAATAENRCLERPESGFVPSPYPHLRPRLYPMHPPYTDDTAPRYDGYTSMESDTTSSYTISRPSSCTIPHSVSTQGNSFLRNSLPLQQQSSHGSSPEWTPPSTPLYVQFHSTCSFGNAQVESPQNSTRVQHFNNQARAYPSITPSNNAFIPTQVTFAEGRSKALSYAGMRKNCMEPRQDNNELLVRLRDEGISYKEIKKRLNCPEAESTLRGRHRTLTKDKSQRVRKPVWTDNDIRILINCVTGLILSPQNNQVSEERESGCKISARWKYISEEILRVGGSYKFGPGTCKKKYKELVETGVAPAIQELEKRRGCRGSEIREERCARLRGRRKSTRRASKAKCSSK